MCLPDDHIQETMDVVSNEVGVRRRIRNRSGKGSRGSYIDSEKTNQGTPG